MCVSSLTHHGGERKSESGMRVTQGVGCYGTWKSENLKCMSVWWGTGMTEKDPQLHLESMSREASAWIERVPGSGRLVMCCSAKASALEQVQHKDEAAK